MQPETFRPIGGIVSALVARVLRHAKERNRD